MVRCGGALTRARWLGRLLGTGEVVDWGCCSTGTVWSLVGEGPAEQILRHDSAFDRGIFGGRRAVFHDRLYFTEHDYMLEYLDKRVKDKTWVTDGTTSGTQQHGAWGSSDLLVRGDTLYLVHGKGESLSAFDGAGETQLALMTDHCPTFVECKIDGIEAVGNAVFYRVIEPTGRHHLHRHDPDDPVTTRTIADSAAWITMLGASTAGLFYRADGVLRLANGYVEATADSVVLQDPAVSFNSCVECEGRYYLWQTDYSAGTASLVESDGTVSGTTAPVTASGPGLWLHQCDSSGLLVFGYDSNQAINGLWRILPTGAMELLYQHPEPTSSAAFRDGHLYLVEVNATLELVRLLRVPLTAGTLEADELGVLQGAEAPLAMEFGPGRVYVADRSHIWTTVLP